MPRGRSLLLAAIAVALPFVALLALVEGYYAFEKLTQPARMAGSFGRIDGELGWALAPNASARLWMASSLTGEVYYDSRVHTDSLGFRAAEPGREPAIGGVAALGDSWTFGYAVDFEDSYPARLETLLGVPVANMAVPAYGAAQALLLLERHAAKLRPRAVVYLDQGLWQRSLCHGEGRPRTILKPCFWRDPATGRIELVKPPPGLVRDAAAAGVYPGGWLTAAAPTWGYYLVSRPAVRFQQILTAAGLMPGHRSEYDADPVLGPSAIAYVLARFVALAREHGFVFVLVDPDDAYREAVEDLAAEDRSRVIHVGRADWRREVVEPAAGLSPDERRVPKDRHFGPGTNRLVAALVARRLAASAAFAGALTGSPPSPKVPARGASRGSPAASGTDP